MDERDAPALSKKFLFFLQIANFIDNLFGTQRESLFAEASSARRRRERAGWRARGETRESNARASDVSNTYIFMVPVQWSRLIKKTCACSEQLEIALACNTHVYALIAVAKKLQTSRPLNTHGVAGVQYPLLLGWILHWERCRNFILTLD
uniref:Uncharacterized protein n=1 Tax=Steinernema glaseri TaxID=37863 RepID=A0A1I8A8A9_9BILA